MQNANKSIRVFKSPFLERMTHVHPLTPLIVWGPVAGWLIWRSYSVHELSLAAILSVGVAGFVSWTFTEYVLHRFLFHFEPDNAVGRRVHFLIHGIHHEDPNDATRLVMPPVAGAVIAIVLYNLFSWILGPVWVEPFFGFFLVGYLCYDYTHFAVHHFKPRTRFGKYLKNSHMQHHFVSPDSRYGVSSPLWDYVFGTSEDVKKKREQTA